MFGLNQNYLKKSYGEILAYLGQILGCDKIVPNQNKAMKTYLKFNFLWNP